MSFLSSPRKPDRWPLRPGDLPPPGMIAREPLLAGLEENPLFRLMVFRKHISWAWKSAVMAMWIALLAVPLVGVRFDLPRMGFAGGVYVSAPSLRGGGGAFPHMGLAGAIYFYICMVAVGLLEIQTFRRLERLIPDQVVSQVWLAGLPERACASAYWASFLQPGLLFHRRMIPVALTLAGAGMVISALPNPQLTPLYLFADLMLFLGGLGLGLRPFIPWAALPFALLNLRQRRRVVEMRLRRRLFLPMLELVLFGYATILPNQLALAACMLPSAAWALAIRRMPLRADLREWLMLPGSAAVALAVGLVCGVLRGRSLRRRAPELFDEVARELGAILRLRVESVEGEKRVYWDQTAWGLRRAKKGGAKRP